MTILRASLLWMTCAAMVISADGASVAGRAEQQVFRAGTRAVTVPVSVKVSGDVVGGLTSADFLLLDNGVRQPVQIMNSEAVPADITVVVETSQAMSAYLNSMEQQVRAIAAMLRPADRLEVIEAATYVQQRMPLAAAAERGPVPSLAAGGLSSIYDAIVAALLEEPDGQRPHLVIVLSDTVDTMSATNIETVTNVARFSSSILTVAWITLDSRGTTTSERAESHQRAATAIKDGSYARTEPPTRPWYPHYDPPRGRRMHAFDSIKKAAELTGGRVYLPGIFTDRTASDIFAKLYADFRQRYVLQYTAEGVPTTGWHDIVVRIPRLPKATISAKRGYFVEK
jgi:VWFA-related protein